MRHHCTVAIIGAGYMGREHVKAFAGIPGVTLAGIMGRTPARAQALAAEFAIPCVASDVAELYDRTQADLVVVAVPELEAKKVLLAAFRHPWTILAEKPVGYCLEEAETITRAADDLKKKIFVALNRRFYGATQKALAGLEADSHPRVIEVFDQEDPRAALTYGAPPEVVRHWMYANSIHLVDYFRIFGRGAITSVERVIPWTPDSPAHVAAAVRFESGDIGLYHAVWNGPGPWACVVSTPEARWEMRPLESLGKQPTGERRLTPIEPSSVDERFKPGVYRQAEEAVKAALGLPSASVPLAVATASMRLVHDIYGV